MAEQEPFRESGLEFHLDPERVFRPEAPPGKGYQGVPACDFVWQRKPGWVEIVEVKTTIPRDARDLRDNLRHLREQYLHGLLLWLAAAFGRHGSGVMPPEALQGREAAVLKARFVLVVSGLQARHLPDFQQALRGHLQGLTRAFAMEQPLVLDEDQARQKLPVT